ncbi:MAG: response regulator [Desulfobaccales bacterium]
MSEINMLDQRMPPWLLEKETIMNKPYAVVLADSHDMVRREIKRILEAMGGIRVVGEAGDGLQLLEVLKATAPDMVIVDISMPSLRDIEAIRIIRALYSDVKVIFLSMYEHKEYMNYALDNGADGFIFKLNLDMELYPAIRQIRSGEVYISPIASQG